jgi:hypothetical protein
MAWRNCRQAGRQRAQGREHAQEAFSAVCPKESSQAQCCCRPRHWQARGPFPWQFYPCCAVLRCAVQCSAVLPPA